MLRSLFQREPVRVFLYSLLVPLCGTLVARGYMTEDMVPYFLAGGAAFLGVAATEAARKKTEPTVVTSIPEEPPVEVPGEVEE